MKYLLLILAFLSLSATASECSLYETTHPKYPLSGAHLSTGKCSTCASCHKGGIFTGTPRTCIQCHNGDPAWQTVGRSTRHIPTLSIDCASCHTTIAFTPVSITQMNHLVLLGYKCTQCHLSGLNYSGGQQKMSLTHHQKTPVPTDCSMVGCHRPLGTTGTLYRQWDN